MVQTADTIFRDFETDGVPASGKHKPKKSEIRPWGTRLENLYSAAQAGGGLAYETKAAMDADLAHAANQIAWVMEDPTAANNGIYQKVGASGSGSWNRLGDLPYSYIKASNAGAGTANAIVATTSIPIPAADGGALIALPIVVANTASPVTVSFNGASALTVKTSSGNDVSVGGLTAGMIAAGYVSGTTFRLLTDQASAAVVADAEAAADRAEAAAANATGAAPVVDLAAMKALDSTAKKAVVVRTGKGTGLWWWQDGDFSTQVAADTDEATVAKADAVSASAGAWVRDLSKDVTLTPYHFGGSTVFGADESVAVQKLFDFVMASWNANAFGFDYRIGLANRMWKVGTSIDATLLRQPGIRIIDGGLYGTCAGKPVLDLAGTNQPYLENVFVYGDKASAPSVGFLFSRAQFGGSLVPVPNATMIGCGTDGYFSQSAFVNLASEVFTSLGCRFINHHRGLTAASGVIASNYDVISGRIGTIASVYATIQASADGDQSCILHRMYDTIFMRAQDYYLEVQSVTKGSTTTITLPTGSVATYDIAVGDQIWIDNWTGMTDMNGSYEAITAVSGDTITIAVNSSGYGTFTAGHLRNRTGPALVLGGCKGLSLQDSYLLSYGNDAIQVDLENANLVRDWKINFQHEASPVTTIHWFLPSSGTTVCRNIVIESLGDNQVTSGQVMTATTSGTGKLELQSSTVRLSQNTSGVAIFGDPANWILRHVDVHTQYDNAISSFMVAAMAGAYDVRVHAADNDDIAVYSPGYSHADGTSNWGTYSASGATDGKLIDSQFIRSSRTGTSTTAHMQFANPNGVVGQIQTNGTGTIFLTTSDATLKNDKGRLDPAVATKLLNKILVHAFSWKSNKEDDIGVFAQELYKVFPQAVSVGGFNEDGSEYTPWGVDYSRLVPVVISAVQGLDERVKVLEAMAA